METARIVFARERKPIDASLKSYLEAVAAAAASQPAGNDPVRTRRALILQALKSRSAIPGLSNGVKTQDVTLPAGLAARVYTPSEASAPLSMLVYAHGGGWVVGSIETHDPFCRLLTEAAGIIVFSLEYRLAPEHPFPAGLDDVLAAYRWVAAHAGHFGGDPNRLLLGGDSAGANLAAVTANHLCAAGGATPPVGLMLLYPVTDHPGAQHASYTENATGYGLDANLMHWFWDEYARDIPPDDPGISPLRLQNVPALPPTLVATAEYDPLRDEGIEYAEKLRRAGIVVTHVHAPDMHHNFPVNPGTVARFPQSIAALNEFAAWLRATVPEPQLKSNLS